MKGIWAGALVLMGMVTVATYAQEAPPLLPPPTIPAPPPSAPPPAIDLTMPPPPMTTGIPVVPLVEKPKPKIWTGSAELGLGGSEGNSPNQKIRLGGDLKRETDQNILKADFLYSFASNEDTVTQNRSITKGRYERLLGASPWSLFVSGQAETDEFTAYDLRLSGYGGVGYRFWKTEFSMFKGRLGFGGSQEFGSPDDDFHPEMDFGFDLEHCITKRQKIVASFDYYPTITEWSDYRVQGKVTYDFLIDPEWNITLRLGVLDRYDSTPQGKKPNDVDYFATLLWKF